MKKSHVPISDYDLNALKDTKGGFFAEDEPEDVGSQQRTAINIVHETPIAYPLENNEKCISCEGIELDDYLKRHYGVNVCVSCKVVHKDRFKLITKTQAKEEFLLTEGELNDPVLKHISKPNPHKSTWSDMKLFLRMQVQDFALQRWGTLEAIERERQKRENQLIQRKEKRFKRKLLELRKKTRTDLWKNKREDGPSHVHTFTVTASGSSRCSGCGLEIEEEEL